MKQGRSGTRIVASFGLVILICAALGVFAVAKVGAIEKGSTQIRAHALPSIYLAGHVQSGVLRQDALLVQHIHPSDQEVAGKMQVNKAIQQLDQMIQQNAAGSEEMASTSEELASQALLSAVAFFKLGGHGGPEMQDRPSLQKSIARTTGPTGWGWGNMRRTVRPPGPAITLSSNRGNNDAKDGEFSLYRE